MAKFQVYKSTNGEFRWRFRADNGEIIATSSEGYTTKRSCEHGIELVKTKSPTAQVEDQTTE
jgi:uncharacterized protein YegP (UPF0339 family)